MIFDCHESLNSTYLPFHSLHVLVSLDMGLIAYLEFCMMGHVFMLISGRCSGFMRLLAQVRSVVIVHGHLDFISLV